MIQQHAILFFIPRSSAIDQNTQFYFENNSETTSLYSGTNYHGTRPQPPKPLPLHQHACFPSGAAHQKPTQRAHQGLSPCSIPKER